MATSHPIRDKLILEMWANGWTGDPIIRALSQKGYSLTRSAIAGVVARAGMQRKAGGCAYVRPREARTSKALSDPVILANEPQAIGPIGHMPEPGCCQYLKGSPDAKMQACGQLSMPKRPSWCQWHWDNIVKNPKAYKKSKVG